MFLFADQSGKKKPTLTEKTEVLLMATWIWLQSKNVYYSTHVNMFKDIKIEFFDSFKMY